MSTPTIFVLSTRQLSAALIDEAAASGVRLDALEFIRTEPMPVNDLPKGPVAVVFTSQQAVEALPAAGVGWTIFCIEGATRRLAETKFGEGAIAGAASSAGELAKVIIDAAVGKPVVFFCGDQRLDALPVQLREAGIAVEERIVYRTLLTPHRLEREYRGIAFFSPSAVESFFSMNAVSAETVLFAIGRTTAAAILARTGREAIVSSRPDKEVLIHQMIAYFTI